MSFFEDSKFASKTIKFYSKWPERTVEQKHELQFLKKSRDLKFFMQ